MESGANVRNMDPDSRFRRDRVSKCVCVRVRTYRLGFHDDADALM